MVSRVLLRSRTFELMHRIFQTDFSGFRPLAFKDRSFRGATIAGDGSDTPEEYIERVVSDNSSNPVPSEKGLGSLSPVLIPFRLFLSYLYLPAARFTNQECLGHT